MLCEGGELEMWMGRPGGMHTYVAIEEEEEEEADAVIGLGFLAMAAGTKWLRNIGPVQDKEVAHSAGQSADSGSGFLFHRNGCRSHQFASVCSLLSSANS